METKKYVFTEKTTSYLGHILHQIKAVKNFGSVHKGELGGWIESEKNLSHKGDCWVTSEAIVLGEALVYEDALIWDKAEVFSYARVYGKAIVQDSARVYGDARVSERAIISETTHICGNAQILGSVNLRGTAVIKTTAYIQSQYDYLSIENLGSRQGTTTFYRTKEGGIDVACGCFSGSIEEFLEAVEKTHRGDKHEKVYKNAIQMAKRTILRAQTPKSEKHSPNIKVLHHREICSGLSDLYEKKNHDYGDSFHETFLQEGWVMPRIRLGDKYRRFCALTSASEGPLVEDESLRDTLLDLANYAILTVLEMDCGLGAAESTARPNPLPQAMVEAVNISKRLDKALSREEEEARDQTYYYNNELPSVKNEMDRSLRKLLDILKDQEVDLSMYTAEDCNHFINELLRNKVYKGDNHYRFRNASCNLIASLILLLTDMGHTKSQIQSYILDKWNQEIKVINGG